MKDCCNSNVAGMCDLHHCKMGGAVGYLSVTYVHMHVTNGDTKHFVHSIA